MKIEKIEAFPLAYPEPHYKGIERYITLRSCGDRRRSRGLGRVYLAVSRGDTRNKDNY